MLNTYERKPGQSLGPDPFTELPELSERFSWREMQETAAEEPDPTGEPAWTADPADANDYPEYYLG